MNLKARFSIIAAGIVIFIVLAPMLVLYARGFKYDFKTGALVKTGTLVIRTEPSDVSLFLNEEPDEYKAPATIRFLVPGDYTVKLHKDGYHSWQKRLTINSQFVTWGSIDRDKIFLFRESPQLHSTWQHDAVAISKDDSEIAFQNKGSEYVIVVNSGEIKNLGQGSSVKLSLPAEPAKIFWTNASQIWQLLQTTETLPMDEEFSQIQQVHSNGDHTALLVGNRLYSFEVSSMPLVDEGVTGLAISGDDLWYVSGTDLKHYSFSSGKTDILAQDLPLHSNSQIIRGNNQVYLLINQNLYQVKDTAEKIYGPVTFARWEQNAQRIVYGNDNEIYLHNPLTNKSSLVLRSLIPITQARINWTTGYLFYVTENRIMAAELDTRNGQNQFKIMDIDSSETFIVSADGFKLYKTGRDSTRMYLIR